MHFDDAIIQRNDSSVHRIITTADKILLFLGEQEFNREHKYHSRNGKSQFHEKQIKIKPIFA